VFAGTALSATELLIGKSPAVSLGELGVTATATELNYVSGVTSAIQTQIDGKEPADATILKDADIGSTVLGYVAPSTSGNILTSNGSVWQSVAPAGGGFSTLVTLTSSTTWSIPSGVTAIKIYVTGGGGGGNSSWFSGGGGGGTAIKYLDVSAGGSITITVGSGSPSYSGAGGSSSAVYGAINIGASGGSGAINGTVSGGVGTNGDINIRGGSVARGMENGGSSFWGGPHTTAGGSFGAGGSTYYNSSGAAATSDGQSGVVVIEY
jgi:hypothetical protein